MTHSATSLRHSAVPTGFSTASSSSDIGSGRAIVPRPRAASEGPALGRWLKQRKAQDLRGGSPSREELAGVMAQALDPAARLKPQEVRTIVYRVCRALPRPMPATLLDTLLEKVHAAALTCEDFHTRCMFAFEAMAQVAAPKTAIEKAQQLETLLSPALRLDDQEVDVPLMFAAWYALATQWLGPRDTIEFTLRALGPASACSDVTLLHLSGRIALQQMLALGDEPAQVLPQLGQVLAWLIAQDGERRRLGLSGFGQGLQMSPQFEARHLCEMLQAVASLRHDIQSRGCAAAIRDMVDAMAGDEDTAATMILNLDERSRTDADRVPEDEAVATLTGLFIGTLHPHLSGAEMRNRLPSFLSLLRLPCLSEAALASVGQALGHVLGGPQVEVPLLEALVNALASCEAAPLRSGALLRGLLGASGGASIDDARLAAAAGVLGATTSAAGPALTVALAAATGTLTSSRAPALQALDSRLRRLLAPGALDDTGPLPAPLQLGLALANNPLVAPTQDMAGADRRACVEAAFATPGLLDKDTVAHLVWACALLAGTDTDLALDAAILLLDHGGAWLTPAEFRELRAALLPQAGDKPDRVAGLYRRFVQRGHFEAPAPARSEHKGKPSAGLPARPRKYAAQLRFVQDEAALLQRGVAGQTLAPLVASLHALATELAGGNKGAGK